MSTTAEQVSASGSESFLTMRQITEQTRYSRPSIYRLIRDAGFPRPLKMAPGGKVLFRSGEVADWLASRPRA
jgi:predicted DNA-binding transcriptional regulator AlpA